MLLDIYLCLGSVLKVIVHLVAGAKIKNVIFLETFKSVPNTSR